MMLENLTNEYLNYAKVCCRKWNQHKK